MKLELVSFKKEHLEHIISTGFLDEKNRPWLVPAAGEGLEKSGCVQTILDNGVPKVIGGIIKYWPGRGEAWLVFSKDTNPQSFVGMFRLLKKLLYASDLKRIEMVVDYGSEVHRRWAEMLGFKKEGERLRHYLPGGEDVTLYSLVRD